MFRNPPQGKCLKTQTLMPENVSILLHSVATYQYYLYQRSWNHMVSQNGILSRFNFSTNTTKTGKVCHLNNSQKWEPCIYVYKIRLCYVYFMFVPKCKSK